MGFNSGFKGLNNTLITANFTYTKHRSSKNTVTMEDSGVTLHRQEKPAAFLHASEAAAPAEQGTNRSEYTIDK